MAGGVVPGRVIQGPAMDEEAGTFRIVTREYVGGDQYINHLSILGQTDGRLEPVGSATILEGGDRIRAVGFLGDTAIVASTGSGTTQTIDLSDAANPRVIGELLSATA